MGVDVVGVARPLSSRAAARREGRRAEPLAVARQRVAVRPGAAAAAVGPAGGRNAEHRVVDVDRVVHRGREERGFRK